MKYHHLLFPFLVMSGALPPAAADDTQNAGMIAVMTTPPRSVNGFRIEFDSSEAESCSLNDEDMSFAIASKFAHHQSLDWSRKRPEMQALPMSEIFFENLTWTTRAMYASHLAPLHFDYQPLSDDKLFLTLSGSKKGVWILLDFATPNSGSAVWGVGREMMRHVRFSLSPHYVADSAQAGDTLPKQVECGLFIFDSFALWRQDHHTYFCRDARYDEMQPEAPVIRYAGKDAYEDMFYEDQYGRRWSRCEKFHYSAAGRNGLLEFTARLDGSSYILSYEAEVFCEVDMGHVYSEAAAELTLDGVGDGGYRCRVTGYYGMDGDQDEPARMTNARILLYTNDLSNTKLADSTGAKESPEQVIAKRKYRKAEELVKRPVTFRTLCERVLEENTRANWDALEAYYDEHKERFTKLQRELFPLGYFYAGQFKHPTSRHYAKRLTEIIPQILIDGNVRTPHVSGNTALHYSAAMGSSNLTKWLIEQGALINARNQDGQTPLDCLGVSKKGLDKWMIARGAERTHPVKAQGPILKEKGSTSYAAAAAKPPTPAPAPAASLHEQAEKLAHDLIAGVNNDMKLLLSCYAERVNYFGQTGFTHEQIRKDNVVFRHKYPKRDFQVRDVTIRKQDENRYRITVMVKGLRWDTADKPQHIELLYKLDARLVGGKFSVFCIRTDIIPKS